MYSVKETVGKGGREGGREKGSRIIKKRKNIVPTGIK